MYLGLQVGPAVRVAGLGGQQRPLARVEGAAPAAESPADTESETGPPSPFKLLQLRSPVSRPCGWQSTRNTDLSYGFSGSYHYSLSPEPGQGSGGLLPGQG